MIYSAIIRGGRSQALGGLVFTETVKFQDCYFALTPGEWKV